MKKQIISRWESSKVLYECEVPDYVPSDLAMRYALESAVAQRPRLDLRGADLSGANVSGANLKGVDLSKANLEGTYLTEADLVGADLSGAYMHRAYLNRSYLIGADLRNADLSDANLHHSYLRNADLSGADLRNADLSGAALRNADLSGADLRYAYLHCAELRDTDLRDAYLTGADGEQLSRATAQQAIENLDKVRAIVLADEEKLNMACWHSDAAWEKRTCVQETLCRTTHCMAGWLQVCSTEHALKGVAAYLAGALAAPVAAKMFFS